MEYRCKIIKWHHLNNIVWNDYTIDDKGIVRRNGEKIQQFEYKVHFVTNMKMDIRPYVKLPTQKGFTKVPIHILLMQSAVGYFERMDVCHLDGNKFNNNLSNLKYLTRSEHRKFDGSQGYTKSNENKKTKIDLIISKQQNGYRGHYSQDDWHNEGEFIFE